MRDNAVVLFSGGLDSTVVVAQEVEAGLPPHLLFFAYGQSQEEQEFLVARQFADRMSLSLEVQALPSLAKTDAVVWGARNGLMAMAGAAVALRCGLNRIALGCNFSDWERFPDCRPDFWKAVNMVLHCYNVSASMPLLRLTKTQVWREAQRLGICAEDTWSCYSPAKGQPCGQCLACKTREEALKK